MNLRPFPIVCAFAAALLLAAPFPARAITYNWTSQSVSGTEASGTDVRFWAPGMSTGHFTFSYSFYSVPDSVVITFGGQPVFSSGGYVSGSQAVSLSFGPSAPGSTPLLEVMMNPQGPRPGTAWDYTLTPTAKPVLSSLSVEGPFSLGENGTGVYTATARYDNGSTKLVTASWKSSTALLRVSPAGTHMEALATGITKTVNATLTATYAEDGVSKNGTFTVSLSNQAVANNPNEEEKTNPDGNEESQEGGPIHTGTGAESFYRPLIAISGARGFEFGLHYSSTFSAIASPAGGGWSHPHGARFQEASSGSVTIRWSPTRANTYALVRVASGVYYACPDDDARFDVLAKTADGGFTLTKPDQTRYSFNSSGNLFEIANKHGQRLVVSSSSGIVSSILEPVSGAALTFTHSGGFLTRVADNLGRSVNLTYNADGLLTSITDLDGRTTSYAYGTNRKLATVTAPDGTVTYRNTYDTLGRVSSQDDGIGSNKLMLFAYSESPGRIVTTVTNRLGYKTIYTHDQKYRLLSKRNPLGHTVTYTYDTQGNRITERDPLGRVTTTSYDTRGNPTRIVAANGGETLMTYDARNNLTRIVNADGRASTITYDAANNPLTITDFAGAAVTRTYNANAQIATERTARGNTTTYNYTAGRLSSVINPLGETTGFAYDAAGRMTSTTNPAGRTTAFTYSASSKVLTETDPNGGVIRHAYDVRNRLVTVTDALGGVTTRTYDANNNELSITNALGGVTVNVYDGEDRLVRQTDPLGRVSTTVYDAAGRIISTTNALNQITRYTYDAAGNRLSVTSPTAAVSSVTFSPVNLPLITRDPLGRVTTMARDLAGRVTSTTDPLKRATLTQFDAQGRPTSSTDAAGLAVRRAYDADGNMTTLTNASGGNITFTYDGAGRRTVQQSPAGRVTSHLYESRGLVSRVTEPSGQMTNNSYDNGGRLVTRADAVGITTYTYDAKNRPVTTVENGRTITRVYDALDRLTRFTDGNGNVLQYAYDAAGNLITLTYPDGKQVQYTYDGANRLTRVTDWAGRITNYVYDASGRLLQTTRPNGTKQLRVYDRAGQLTSVRELTSGNANIVTIANAYDLGGQLVTQTRTPAAPVTAPSLVSMTYDADDRLASFNGTATTSDADGNMTSGPITTGFGSFTYDARNRLTGAGGLSYTYDAEDRRITSTSGGSTTTYVNNPNAPLWQVLTCQTGAGPITYCVHGLGLLYTDTNSTPLYHHYDLRGSTVATTNAAQAITFSTAYGAHGERIPISGGPAQTPFLFVGQSGVITDANELCFSRARYYSPLAKRFVNADPIGLGGGMNCYAYADNNPTLMVDPSGLDAIIEVGFTQAAGYGVHGRYHTFTLITDTVTGQQYVTRAGPSSNSAGASASNSAASGSGGSVSGTAGNASSGGFGFGQLQGDTGLYTTHPRDNPGSTVQTQYVGTIRGDVADVIAAARAFEQITNNNKIPYTPLGGGISGYNSNAYTGTFIESLGFTRPIPNLSSPGFGNGNPSDKLPYGPFPQTEFNPGGNWK